MANERPPFPGQQGGQIGADRVFDSTHQTQEGQFDQARFAQSPVQSESHSQDFGAPQETQVQRTQVPRNQQPLDTQINQTQERVSNSYADTMTSQASRASHESQHEQVSAPAHYAAPAPQAEASRPRRGGGLKTAILALVFGMIGAFGVVMIMRQFGLLGNTTVISESGEGKTVAITASAEDATVAKAVADKVLPSVVSVHVTAASGSGLGSGVILDTEGNILTNNHVAGGAESISVTIGGKSYDAKLVGTDASSDLAVIKADLQGTKVTPIERGDSDKLVVGDWVMTVGSPFGLDQSVSSGIVSSLARNELMTSYSGNTLYANLIQTDAAINPGNSGGALVNERGQLVGISTLFSSDTESFAGIGFAIPGNYAFDVAEKIIAGETVTHAYIGLSMQTVNAQNAARNNLPVSQGAYVAEVAEGGPAAEAGIKVGDIITAVNGESISSADGMILAVRSHKIDETIEVTLMRGKEEQTVKVTLGSDEALQAQQQKLLDEQQNTQVDGRNGNTRNNGTTDSYGQRDILQELYEYLYNNRGGSYELTNDAA